MGRGSFSYHCSGFGLPSLSPFKRPRDYLNLVDDLTECWKLVPLQGFVEYFLARAGIEHPVMVVVVVEVDVVVSQYRMSVGEPCGVPVRYSPDLAEAADVARFEPLVDFQDDTAMAVHEAGEINGASGRVLGEGESVGARTVYERVLVNALVVDGLVVVPGVPVVRVSSVR